MDFNAIAFSYESAEFSCSFLMITGAISLFLLFVFAILGTILYKKYKKKIIINASIILCFIYAIIVYLSIPVYMLFLDPMDYTENKTPAKYSNLAAKLTPFKQLKAYCYEISGIQYATLGMGCEKNKNFCKYSKLALQSHEKACELNAPMGCYMAAYYATLQGDYNKALSLYVNMGEKLIYRYTQPILEVCILKQDYELAFQIASTINDKADKYVAYYNIYRSMRDYKNALKYINMAIKINPKVWTYYSMRALIYHEMGNEELAKNDYKKAKRISPKYCNREYSKFLRHMAFEDNYKELSKRYFGN